jgi:non-ribosomal peptide synthetase component F
VPSVLQLWLPQLRHHGPRLQLQQLVSSGEALSNALAAELKAVLPPACVLLNLYGGFTQQIWLCGGPPASGAHTVSLACGTLAHSFLLCASAAAGSTEVSADATCQLVTQQLLDSSRDGSSSPGRGTCWVPAGAPISSMAVAVVACDTPAGGDTTLQPAEPAAETGSCARSPSPGDAVLQLLPLGAEGEVLLAGLGLAAGYTPDNSIEQPEAAAAAWEGRGDVASASSHGQQRFVHARVCPHVAATSASLAAGPGWSARGPCMWFRTGDLGWLDAAGEHQLLLCLHTGH